LLNPGTFLPFTTTRILARNLKGGSSDRILERQLCEEWRRYSCSTNTFLTSSCGCSSPPFPCLILHPYIISGQSHGYVLGAEATQAPIFHPNCPYDIEYMSTLRNCRGTYVVSPRIQGSFLLTYETIGSDSYPVPFENAALGHPDANSIQNRPASSSAVNTCQIVTLPV